LKGGTNMSICENCKHLKREYSTVERKVCGKTGKVLVKLRKSCKKFEPEEKGRD